MVLQEEMNLYIEYCKHQKKLDYKTINAYRSDIEQFILYINNSKQVSKEELNSYISYIHSQYKAKTVKRKIASIRAFFYYLEEEERIDNNPFHKIKTKFKEEIILPKIIPRNMIEQLLKYLYKKEQLCEIHPWKKRLILRDIAVVETLFATGLRISELCGMQSRAFDMETGILCIKGKGRKERYLQIGNDDVLALLKRYRETFQKEIQIHGFFFVNRYGEPLSEQSARRMLHKYAKEIWEDMDITPHMFRHSFATFLMEEDVNIRYIQKMLGHASITTTQIYTYVALEKEREILRNRHPRNKMQVEETNEYY